MYIKELTIEKANGEVIREIPFHKGLNLIIDQTPIENGKETGNNVGKTTVLKLIDFCFGAKARDIYTDQENQRNEYKLVKDYLISNGILITLSLIENINDKNTKQTIIERNFLARKNKVQRINGQNLTDDEYEECLTSLLFPGHYNKKPTFRQIISHNIRYSDLSLTNTLKILDRYTRDDEYETLYLFLFGCNFENGDTKQILRTQIDLEEKFKNRLEAEQTKSAYEAALSLLMSDIEELESKKGLINISPEFEKELDELNTTKYKINELTYSIGNLELKKSLINEASMQINSTETKIDLVQLKQIYEQATSLASGIQKTFEQLVKFHNAMIASKIKFITKDLPELENQILNSKDELKKLLDEEKIQNRKITQSNSFDDLEVIIGKLNEKYQKIGEYENKISQIKATEVKLANLNKDLADIDNTLFSEDYKLEVQAQVNKFNKHFSTVSSELYDEKYAIKVDEKVTKGRKIYEFTAFNTNFSSGKKQGEITCFDLAYTLFADEEGIPCLHFLLNDKKELMHDNQLLRISEFADRNDIQFVTAILQDKLPEELNKEKNIIIKLSQDDKLFRIEKENTKYNFYKVSHK